MILDCIAMAFWICSLFLVRKKSWSDIIMYGYVARWEGEVPG